MTVHLILTRLIYVAVFSGCFFYLTFRLERRHGWVVSFLILLGALFLTYAPTDNTLMLTLIRYLKFILLFSGWSILFLRCRAPYAIYLSVFFTIFMGVCFSVMQILFLLLGIASSPLLTFCSGLLRIAAVITLKRFFIQIDGDRRPTLHEVFLGLFPAAACFAANLVVFDYLIADRSLMSGAYRSLICLLVLFFALSSMVVLVSSEQYFLLSRYREENERATRQLNEQYALFLKESEKNEQIRSLYHDMKNHLQTIQRMQQTADVRRYIQDLDQTLEHLSPAFQTGCPTLDTLLQNKKAECDRLGIHLECYIHLTRHQFISPMEICTLFGNCLDNAIEAVSDPAVLQKEIHLSGGEVNNTVVITISNPYAHTLKPNRSLFKSTKSSAGIHGYGLLNVCTLIEKLDGSLVIQTENAQFCVCWMIPIPADCP